MTAFDAYLYYGVSGKTYFSSYCSSNTIYHTEDIIMHRAHLFIEELFSFMLDNSPIKHLIKFIKQNLKCKVLFGNAENRLLIFLWIGDRFPSPSIIRWRMSDDGYHYQLSQDSFMFLDTSALLLLLANALRSTEAKIGNDQYILFSLRSKGYGHKPSCKISFGKTGECHERYREVIDGCPSSIALVVMTRFKRHMLLVARKTWNTDRDLVYADLIPTD